MAGSAAPAPGIAEAQGRQTLNSLQVMRGFAAAAVAIYHTHLILAQPQYGSIDLFGSVAGMGWMGVNFFFVLSGFIILYAHLRDVGQPSRVPTYLWRRFARVYPIYWVMLALYVGAAFAGIGHPDFRISVGDTLSAILLVPLVPEPSLPLAVAWTLLYEIGFYALFAIAILNRTAGIVGAGLWVAAILIASLVFDYTGFGPLNMWNIYFPAGAATYFLYRRLDRRWGAPLLAAGCALLVGLALTGHIDHRIALAQSQPERLLLLAAPFVLIMLGATVMERDRAWRAPALLMLIGNASYSIYLVHSPVISVIAQLNHMLVPGLVPPVLLFIVTAIISIIGGVVAHLVLERPLLAWLRHPPGRRPEQGAAMAAGR